MLHNGSIVDVLCFTSYWYSGAKRTVLSYTTILETYSLEELLELNDTTEEEALDFLVTQGFLELPEIKPLDFE